MPLSISRAVLSGFLLIFTIVSFAASGCANHYRLKPKSEKIEHSNGIPLETLVTPKCVLQAGYQASHSDDMLVRVIVTNKSEQAFDLDPTVFSITAGPEILKSSPVRAVNPESYVQELTASAEVFDSRTRMDSYQGIDDLTTLKGGSSDQDIEEAKRPFEAKQKEAEGSKKTAADYRERAATIQNSALKKTTIKPGSTVEGTIVFRTTFVGEGPITITSDHPVCAGDLHFELDR